MGVKVSEQNLLAQIVQSRSQINGGGGFSYAAFLIDNGDDFTHSYSFPFCLLSGFIIPYGPGIAMSFFFLFHVKHSEKTKEQTQHQWHNDH